MKFLLFPALLLAMHCACAQNCNDLEDWSRILRDEYSNVDFRSITSGSALSNRIIYNLYSDKYFIPFGGEPFDKLSDHQGDASWKRVQMCNQKKKVAGDPYIGWIHWIGMEPLSNKMKGDEVARKVVELRNLRAEYNAAIKEIQS